MSLTVEIVGAEIETPLFAGNYGFWNRLKLSLSHVDPAGRSVYQQGAEIRYPPRDFDGHHVDFPPNAMEQSQREHIMGLDIADRIVSRFTAKAGRPLEGNVGVFVAQSESSHQPLSSNASGLYAIGNSRAIVANRISYRFGWTGPSMSVDTACSSGLFAMHLAAQEMKQGQCEAALVLGISNFHSPAIGASLRAAQLLSSTGSLNALQSKRNGYVRSEGVAGVLLVTNDFAKRHGLHSYLTMHATSVNQNSNAQHFSIPDVGGQQTLYREALNMAKWDAAEIDHIEMHATGTNAGDKAELEGIQSVFGGIDRDRPLSLGAVKSNIGHLEGASALAAVVKVVLGMSQSELPPTISNDNMLELPADGSMEFQSAPVPLDSKVPIKIGISSFGFGGSNAFLLAEGHPAKAQDKNIQATEIEDFWFPRLKAASNESLEIDLQNIVKDGTDRANSILSAGAFISSKRGPGVSKFRVADGFDRIVTSAQRKDPLFCFGGQSVPINNDHRHYFETYPEYRKQIENFEELFFQELNWRLIDHYL